jgi:hypothetical protein
VCTVVSLFLYKKRQALGSFWKLCCGIFLEAVVFGSTTIYTAEILCSATKLDLVLPGGAVAGNVGLFSAFPPGLFERSKVSSKVFHCHHRATWRGHSLR